MIRRNLLWAFLGMAAVAPVMAGPVVVVPPRESGDAAALMRTSESSATRTIAAKPLVGSTSKVVVVPARASLSQANYVAPAASAVNEAPATERAMFKPVAVVNDTGSLTPVVDPSAASANNKFADNYVQSSNADNVQADAYDATQTTAQTVAHRSSFSIGVGIGINTYHAPRYYQPVAPVYYRPAYYAPTYYAPYCGPVYYRPAYCPPVYYHAPRYYPAYSYCGPAYPRSGFSFSFHGRF